MVHPYYFCGPAAIFYSAETGLTVRLSPGDGPEATDGTNTVEWAEPHEFYGVLGSEADDTISGDDNPNVIYGGRGADTISGGGTSDDLYGGGGDDELFADGGGPYGDDLSGGKGDDALEGSDGSTQFHFGPGWGHDTITGDPEGWFSLSFDHIPPESIWRPYPNTVENPSDLTIDLSPGEGAEATDGVNTVDWDETVDVYGATGGSGDDEMTGNDEYNQFWGGSGADNIATRGGVDSTYAGADGDTVRSGLGNDVVHAFNTQRDTGVDRVDCGLGDEDKVYIQESNADHVVGCEKVRFTYGGGGGY